MPAPADLVITGAAVYRVDPARSWSDAVAIRGDRIVAVGSAAVRELTGPRTRTLHLPGALVLPGFQDAHIHPPFAGRNRRNVDLSDVAGREAYLQRIGQFAAANPDRAWIVGGGWAMEYFPGGTPRREDLDAIVPDRPVFLFNRDVHGAWVNSAALRAAGIDRDTPDPSDGRIERDPASGDPSGTLHEGAAYSFNDRIVPRPDRAEWEASILNAQEYLHSLGITGWQDAWVTPDTQAAYSAVAEAGRLTARVVGALWWDRHRGPEQIDELLARSEKSTGGFLPRTVKIMVDGVLENYTGALLEPYCDGCGGHSDNRGLTYVDPQILTPAVVRLDAAGLQVHMHAIGDRAVRYALDAVQAAREANGHTDNRHHIAHLQVVQPSDLPRFRSLDVVANCQAYWAQREPQMDELTIPFLGPDRAALQYPFGDLLRNGVTLAMGSDWGVTTADPLQQIEVAVRRVDPENRDNSPFLPDQRIPLTVAVAAFTAGSAFVNHDDEAGTIEVGKRADLAVLDRNIFDERTGLPGDARVTHTIASGQVVFGG
jgi:predicted amidohydrolase YtcJ